MQHAEAHMLLLLQSTLHTPSLNATATPKQPNKQSAPHIQPSKQAAARTHPPGG